ncbi:hypothetical protein [Acidocella aquatica]|uniref:hypothetical protein n=1 Tax=Acidocella aquatica TaxID=1922313 RepID=UPI0024E11094|nr:hypothetical protein [Acidocella aquatica]
MRGSPFSKPPNMAIPHTRGMTGGSLTNFFLKRLFYTKYTLENFSNPILARDVLVSDLMQMFSFLREISPDASAGFPKRTQKTIFSIGTLVTKNEEYEAALKSFLEAGFGPEDCEYLYINNVNTNQASAYHGLNCLLDAAQGDYVILCHQDIRLSFDNRHILEARLSELDMIDQNWGLAGNAGGVALNSLSMRITDIYGENQSIGTFPRKVMSLDENFILVRRRARLGFSNDLSGFHFYGTDICLNANIMGYNAYVINFHLRHLGRGQMGADFHSARRAFEKKWNHALRPRLLQTTCAQIIVGYQCRPDRRIIVFRIKSLLKRIEKTFGHLMKSLMRQS